MAFNNFPYTDLHTLNVDWLLKKVQELTRDQTAASTEMIYANPMEYGAVADGITDDTEAVQKAVNSGKEIVIFPSGQYNFRNIALRNGITIYFGTAEIVTPATDDFLFYGRNVQNVNIIGGYFRRMNQTETLVQSGGDYANLTSGIFQFQNSKNILIRGVHFDDSMTLNNVMAISCTNVLIENCVTNGFHATNFGFFNDCENIKVQNCEIKNGIYKGWQYIYPVASGFTNYRTPYRGIVNYEVSNCTIDTCDWEGIDCHGGKNVRFVNNKIHNTFRWITMYADDRPVLKDGTEWGSAVISENDCANDQNITFPQHLDVNENASLLLHSSYTEKRQIVGMLLSNNTFKNARIKNGRGILDAFYTDNLTLIGNTFTWDSFPESTPEVLFSFIYNHNVQMIGNKVIGFRALNEVVRAYNSRIAIYNNTFIPESGRVLGMVSTNNSRSYYTYGGNSGYFTNVDRTPGSHLYGPGEMIMSSTGYTGKQTAFNSPGLKKANAPAYTSVTGNVSGNSISITDALEIAIPGMAVTIVDNSNNRIDTMISEVDYDTIKITTPIPNSGACTLEFPIAGTVTLFNPQ